MRSDTRSAPDRTLVLTSEAFEFPAEELPPRLRYVGPRLADPAWAAEWAPPLGDDPLVLVGLSSTHQGQRPLLGRIAQALGTLPVRGLITTGPTIPAEVEDAPANVTVVRLGSPRPGAAARGRGGHTRRSRHDDQGAGAGRSRGRRGDGPRPGRRRGARRRRGRGSASAAGASPRKIAAAVAEVLANPSYREGARRLAQVIAEDTAEDRAVAELESLVAYSAKKVASSAPIRSGASSWRKWPQSGSAVTSA